MVRQLSKISPSFTLVRSISVGNRHIKPLLVRPSTRPCQRLVLLGNVHPAREHVSMSVLLLHWLSSSLQASTVGEDGPVSPLGRRPRMASRLPSLPPQHMRASLRDATSARSSREKPSIRKRCMQLGTLEPPWLRVRPRGGWQDAKRG